MLQKESIWIKNTLEQYFTVQNFPLLNVGSSTESFRREVQPYIHNHIFEPLLRKGMAVIHTDMKLDKGVDMVGDLNDTSFREDLRKREVRSILCSNLLEHLTDPRTICNSMTNLLDQGGLIIVTVPHQYPYHKDPIDTMFRPNVETLSSFFPGCELVNAEIVQEEGSFKKILMNSKRYFLIMMIRWLMPFYKFKEWKLMVNDLMEWNKKFEVTCILLRKK